MSHYLDLMESVLTGMIDGDPSFAGEFDFESREIGGDWPSRALTMIGIKRLHQLRVACADVIERDVPGDFVECGVWRGGACIMMRAVLRELNDAWRRVWLFDSFAGLPKPTNPIDSELDLHLKPELAVGLQEVEHNMSKFGFNDVKTVYQKCWFSQLKEKMIPGPDILPNRISVLRLDGDMYSSTMDCLESLYPLLSYGGYCIIDDYGAMHQCRRAVTDYREKYKITCPMHEIDWSGIYWIKGTV